MRNQLLLLSFLPLFCFGQSVGPNNPVSGQCVPSSACLGCPGAEWNTPGNIQFSDNNFSFATLQPNPNCFQSTCFKSRFLYGSNFGFNIPLNATIVGIQAEVQRNPGNPNAVVDSIVRLYIGSAMVGADYASPVTWPNGFFYASYGGATDLWSASWTPVDINDPSFGLFFKIYNSSANITATVAVNHMRMTIYYSLPTGVYSQTSSPSGLSAGIDPGTGKPWFSIFAEVNQTLHASLWDSMGKRIWEEAGVEAPAGLSKHGVNISGLVPGVYFFRIASGADVRTKKILVN